MRRLAGFLLAVGVLTAVGCRSSPCEPSLWDRLFHRQPSGMVMMGDPCGCPCNKPMGMDMAYDGGPIMTAPPGGMAGSVPGGVRGDTTSQGKGFAPQVPYTPEKPPSKDGK